MGFISGVWLVFALVLGLLTPSFVLSETAKANIVSNAVDGTTVFDVTKFGSKGDGKPHYEDGESINGMGMIRAWVAACGNKAGKSKVLIPKGTFVVGQVVFDGPCNFPVTVELQGNIVPDPDWYQFPNHQLILFQQVDGVIFTGSGKIDAHRPPKSENPDRDFDFFQLMPSVTLWNATNLVVDGIRSVNPSAFHVLVTLSQNITIQNVKFNAASLAPESDTSGVYITASNHVTVSDSFIRTGDDCITIAPGSSDIFVSNLTCSAGQGIRIGADPYVPEALDVNKVTVKNCTFNVTSFGVRIHARPEANASKVSDITFEDLVMKRVKNPIVIDQQFPLQSDKPIPAKVEDIRLKNIRGTITTRTSVVAISCSSKSPCENIEIADIRLRYIGKPLPEGALGFSANCSNADVVFAGKHDGLSCSSLH